MKSKDKYLKALLNNGVIEVRSFDIAVCSLFQKRVLINKYLVEMSHWEALFKKLTYIQ